MAKLISECTGARVHSSMNKGKKGESRISWRVNYKTEGIWCNSEEDLIKVLKQIAIVQIHGEEFKPWKLGKDGWNKNADYKEDKEEKIKKEKPLKIEKVKKEKKEKIKKEKKNKEIQNGELEVRPDSKNI